MFTLFKDQESGDFSLTFRVPRVPLKVGDPSSICFNDVQEGRGRPHASQRDCYTGNCFVKFSLSSFCKKEDVAMRRSRTALIVLSTAVTEQPLILMTWQNLPSLRCRSRFRPKRGIQNIRNISVVLDRTVVWLM